MPSSVAHGTAPDPSQGHTDTSSSESAGTHKVTNDNQQPLFKSPRTQGTETEGVSLGSLSSEGFPPPFPIRALRKDNDLHFLLHLGPTYFLK